jgi:hypothetical protein
MYLKVKKIVLILSDGPLGVFNLFYLLVRKICINTLFTRCCANVYCFYQFYRKANSKFLCQLTELLPEVHCQVSVSRKCHV